MNLKTILPWLCVVMFAIGAGALYSSNQKLMSDLAQARQDGEAQKGHAPPDANSGAAPAESDELVQLRKDHEDLLRLRNEVRLLKDEKQQLTKQLQTAQAASAANPQQAQQLQQLAAENQQLKTQTQQAQQFQQANQAVTCINNLRQIDAAKQQWALQNQKPPGSLIGPQDAATYLPNKAMLVCPAGGVYTINPVGIPPICNMPAHVIPK